MKIFLSYPSDERAAAEEIQLALTEAEHEVFFDRDELAAGAKFHQRIQDAIADCDLFVFLITPTAVEAGRYTLTELSLAQQRWKHPKNRVLPVMLRATPYPSIPTYLKAVTIEEPKGNVAAEVLAAVKRLEPLQGTRPVVRHALVGSAAALVLGGAAWGVFQLGVHEGDDPGVGTPPNPIQLRFAYSAPGVTPVELESRKVRAELVVNEKAYSEYLAPQGDYFSLNTAYPKPGTVVDGVLVRPLLHTSSTGAPPQLPVHLCRPDPLPRSSDEYVLLDCREGASCELHRASPRWLQACAAPAPKTARLSWPFAGAWAADGAQRWNVPTVRTLDEHRESMKGVGYTIFEFETDAFRDPRIWAVEVAVRANGVAVDEDGLRAEQRPVANDPAKPFRYRFALEPLDFAGMHAGCEAIELVLRPRLKDGGRGEALRAVLPYVALRDSPGASVALGHGTLRWSAAYTKPPREWSHEAFIASMAYTAAAGPAGQQAARDAALATKRAFDALGLRHDGQPVVAVIRPPLEHGTGRYAYGVTAGLVTATGQVRFTFSPELATAVSTTMRAARSASADARRAIAAEPYVYAVKGNDEREKAGTPEGICRTLDKP